MMMTMRDFHLFVSSIVVSLVVILQCHVLLHHRLVVVATADAEMTSNELSSGSGSNVSMTPSIVNLVTEEEYHQRQRQRQQLTPQDSSTEEQQQRLLLLHSFPSSRQLVVGDFEEFNKLFQDAQISLTSDGQQIEVSERVGLSNLNLKLRNIVCYDISVGDIQIQHRQISAQQIDVTVDIVQLDMECKLNYRYNYGFPPLRGGGTAIISTDDNMASTTLSFYSDNFNQGIPPSTTSSSNSCTNDIEITDMKFDGDFLLDVVEVFEKLIRNTVESKVEDKVCDELGSLGSVFVSDMLDLASDTINEYLQPLDTTITDPLYLETSTLQQLPKQEQQNQQQLLLNLQDTESIIGSWFQQLLQEVDTLLGTKIPDPNGPTYEQYHVNGKDLGINVYMREFFLDNNEDDDRSYTIDLASVPELDPVLFQGHDKLTETIMTLDSIKIYGLDTLTKFDPLDAIGKYTLQNELRWKYLKLELDISIDIQPSTRDDSLLVPKQQQQSSTDTKKRIVEKIRVDFGVDNIDVVGSLLLAINQERLGLLQLGPMLHTEHLMGCLMSVVEQLQVSGLEVQIGNIREPTLTGFISNGIDRVVSDSVLAVFAMYEKSILKAIPNIFQVSVRKMINNDIINKYMEDDTRRVCPDLVTSDTKNTFIDWRDMLLSPRSAVASGGTGLEPYGDIASTVADLVREKFLSVTDQSTGLIELNSLIQSSTLSQSGQEGTLSFPSDVASFVVDNIENNLVRSFVERFEIKLYNTRVHNLDILKAPVSILHPKNTPYTLENMITMGSVPNRPINVTMGFMLSLDGQDDNGDDRKLQEDDSEVGSSYSSSPLEMHHEMDISMSMNSASLAADVFSKVETDKLLRFPLRDILNTNCWLATIPAPHDLDESSFGLAMEQFDMTLAEIDFNVHFIRSTEESPGMVIIPDMLNMLKEVGATTKLTHRLVEYINRLAKSEYVQTQFGRWVSDAPRFCPHSPEYDETAVPTSYDDTLPILALSVDEIDAILFSASLIFEISFIVLMETHRLRPQEPSSALSRQDAFDNIFQAPLVDWTNLDRTTIGSFMEMALKEGRRYLGSSVTDKGTGVRDLGINVLLRDLLIEDGMEDVVFEYDDLGFEVPGIDVNVTSFRIRGLDSITNFDFWSPIAPQTVQNTISWDELGIELDIEVRNSTSSKTLQAFKTSFTVGDVNAAVPLFIAVDQDKLGALDIGSFLDTKNILPCLLSAVADVEITQMILSIGRLDLPEFTGLQADTGAIVSLFTENVFGIYGGKLVAAFPRLFDSTIRNLLNGMISSYLLQDVTCNPGLTNVPNDSHYVDFRDLFLSETASLALGGSGTSPYGNLFRTLLDFAKEFLLSVDADTGLAAVNDVLVEPLTEMQSGERGTLKFDGILFNQGGNVAVGGLDAKIQLQARNARIYNLNSIGSPLTIFDPVNKRPNLLNNTATMGVVDPISFGVEFMFSLLGDDNMQIRNDLDIEIDMHTMSVILTALLKVEESKFFGFPLRDLFDYNCWLYTMPTPVLNSRGVRVDGSSPSAALADLAASVAKLNLNISCLECSSPGMHDLTELLSGPDAKEEVTDVANMALDYITQLLGGEFLQVKIDRLINDSAKRCPHSPQYDPEAQAVIYDAFESPNTDTEITFLILLGGVILGLLVLTGILVCVIRCFVRRRHLRWIEMLPREQVRRILRQQDREQSMESDMNSSTNSMFFSPEIPVAVRWLMPLVIIGNIGFFLSGHLSLGATVNIEAELAGETFRVDKFFEFSMAQSTVDIWKAGGKELAIMILIFSGIWPYVKQIMTLTIWFLPPTMLSISKRGSTLLWIDWLAKWSFTDIFVLVISIAAFRVSVLSPEVNFLPQDFYSINLLVVPLWGLYANMIAQLISQVSSHFIIHYHRRIANNARIAYTNRQELNYSEEKARLQDTEQRSTPSSADMTSDDREECLSEHLFGRPHRGESEKLVARRWVGKVLCAIAFLLLVFVILGCSLPSFSLEVLGLIGVAVESGQEFEDAETKHSIFTVIKLLFEEARFLDTAGDYVGMGTLSVVLLFTVLIVPLVQAAVLLCQWFTPATRKSRNQMLIFIEMLQAWQYAEVYLIAIFVASWQLGPVSQFMINSYCNGLKDTFAQMVYYGILKEEDAQCFSVRSSIEAGSYILGAAAVLLAILNTFVNKAIVQFFRDKDELEKRCHGVEETEDSLKSEGSVSLDDVEESSLTERTSVIHPVPVLFTDRFRWLLRQEPRHDQDIMNKPTDQTRSERLDADTPFLIGDENNAFGPPQINPFPESTDHGVTFAENATSGLSRSLAVFTPPKNIPDTQNEPEINPGGRFVQVNDGNIMAESILNREALDEMEDEWIPGENEVVDAESQGYEGEFTSFPTNSDARLEEMSLGDWQIQQKRI